MKKFLHDFHIELNEDRLGRFKAKCDAFISAHPEWLYLSLLAVACLVFLFVGIDAYPLMDVDETRYAVMARDLASSLDWNSLMLNSVPFLEKPPLYFWLVGLSIKAFGEFSEFAVRLPMAMLSSFLVFFTYYFGKKIISRKFGLISALVLLSSAFFLMLSHIAIIDIVLTVFMTSAIYCGFLTHFCEDKNKKYFWWFFYLFIGLGFLSKGILALAIPLAVIFVYNVITKTARELFRPINLLPGIAIFLALILPWHLDMYQQYGFQFIKEYFLIHHFGRFMGSQYIGRERPFLYFVPVFLLGFLPWTLIFIAAIVDGFKKTIVKFKTTEGKIIDKTLALLEATTNEQKMLLFAVVYFVVIFFMFSISSTKLPTYILPVFPAASLLTGYYWWVSAEKGEHKKTIHNLTLALAGIFAILAIGAFIAFYFLPYELQSKLADIKLPAIVGLCLVAMFLVLRLKTNKALSIFSGYIFTMFFILGLSVVQIFNFVYQTGENELVQYSISSKSTNGVSSKLVTFDFAVKPSVMINYRGNVNFLTEPDFKRLDEILEYKGGPVYVIIKNKNFKGNDKYKRDIEKRLELVDSRERYSLYVKYPNKDEQPKALAPMSFGMPE